METTIRGLPANLARRVDEALISEWSAPPLVGYLSRGQRIEDLRLVSLAEPAEMSLRRLDKVEGTAAVLSGLGWATPAGSSIQERIRLTVAVTCCASVGVMRWQECRVAMADPIEGAMLGALRQWASLTCADLECGHSADGLGARTYDARKAFDELGDGDVPQ
jgi:hypothetical protein